LEILWPAAAAWLIDWLLASAKVWNWSKFVFGVLQLGISGNFFFGFVHSLSLSLSVVAGTPSFADSFSLHLCSNHDAVWLSRDHGEVCVPRYLSSLSLSLWLSFESEIIIFCLEFRMMIEFWCCTFMMES
jgi:hypothetical protein